MIIPPHITTDRRSFSFEGMVPYSSKIRSNMWFGIMRTRTLLYATPLSPTWELSSSNLAKKVWMLPSYLSASIFSWSLAVSCLSLNLSSIVDKNALRVQLSISPFCYRRSCPASCHRSASFFKYFDTTSIRVVSSGMWKAYILRYLCLAFHYPRNLVNLPSNVSGALTGSLLPVSGFIVFLSVWARIAI